MYSYIYKEVHTLAFAEISELVVLKHNTVSWNDAQPTGEDFFSNDALTASMFCGVRTVLTLPLFFLTVEPVFSKLFTHVFMA